MFQRKGSYKVHRLFREWRRVDVLGGCWSVGTKEEAWQTSKEWGEVVRCDGEKVSGGRLVAE